MKRLCLTITAALAFFSEAFSQTTEASDSGLLNDPALPIYIVSAAVVLLLILVMIVTAYTIRVLNILTSESLRETAAMKGVEYQEPKSWWATLIEKMNASVPVEQEKDIELDHSYDGIRELDNHLPPWWKWLFYATIVFSVVYLFVYHVTGTLPLSRDEYQRELAMADEAIRKHMASQPAAVIDENTLVYTADAEIIEKGKTVYTNNACGGCHRDDGGGNTIGPNLTDEYWLHGGSIKDIFLTIKNGVVEKGMPAWGKAMSAQDVRAVTFFVMSLQGTQPADAKGPQGEIFRAPEPVTDSLSIQAALN